MLAQIVTSVQNVLVQKIEKYRGAFRGMLVAPAVTFI